MAGIHDVFNDNDLTAFKVVLQADELAHLLAAYRTAIGRELNEGNFASDMDLLHQVCHDHEAAIEHTDENRVLVFISHVELYANKPDAFFDLVVVNDPLKLLMIDCNRHLFVMGFLRLSY